MGSFFKQAEHIGPKSRITFIHSQRTSDTSCFLDLLSLFDRIGPKHLDSAKRQLDTGVVSFTPLHSHKPTSTVQSPPNSSTKHTRTHARSLTHTLTHPLIPKAETLTQVGLSISLQLHSQ